MCGTRAYYRQCFFFGEGSINRYIYVNGHLLQGISFENKIFLFSIFSLACSSSRATYFLSMVSFSLLVCLLARLWTV